MTENLPKITVITATFNLIKDGREAFFRQCVESVHNQTYPNIEHIVMDGASTDGTLDLIREYEEKGWLKCYSEPDEGMWDGMNKGLRRATGDYIQFLNSDDFFISNKVLEECATVMANKQTDYLFGNFCICDKNNNISRQIASLPIELFWYHQPYNHEALFVKKSVYLRLGGYDMKYKTTIDYAFIIKLILNDCSHEYIDRPIIASRPGGATNNKNGFTETVLDTVSLLYSDLYTSFCDYTRDQYKQLFCKKDFEPSFLSLLQRFVVKKKLSNFNYAFFLKKTEVKNNTLIDNNFATKRKTRLFLFGFIPLLKIVKLKNSISYRLFNIITIFKIKG